MLLKSLLRPKVVPLVMLATAACSKQMDVPADFVSGLRVEASHAELSGTVLLAPELAEINALVAQTKPRQVEVYDKPEFVITFESDQGEPVIYSVFADYVYVGGYLDAWSDRMGGRSSTVHEVDPDLLALLARVRVPPS